MLRMKLRFFIIDDEEGLRQLLHEYLTFLGHEVICAENPTAENVCNKSICSSELPCADGYFVDYSMPEMNGIDYLESVVKRGCKPPTQNKVLMSGNLPLDVFDRATKIGCTVLYKPFGLEEIRGLVEEMSARVDPSRKLSDLSAMGTI
jgi:DNA-binding NtrC family response regulator